MNIDSPQHIFSSPDNFDSGSSCVYQLHTSSPLISGYRVVTKSLKNCTVEIYTRDQRSSKITHITDIESSEVTSSILIDHMEDVYIVAKSQGQNAAMSLTANLQTSSEKDTKGNLSQGYNYRDKGNYNVSYARSSFRNIQYAYDSTNNEDKKESSRTDEIIAWSIGGFVVCYM